MMNPFYNPPSNQSMIEQFKKFASMFRGNPKQQVEQLLRSGQMTQEEFNEYSKMANDLSSIFSRR